jgi:hypothetical protein
VYDGAQAEILLYVDGQLSGEENTQYSAGFDSVTAPLNLGWLNLSEGYHYQGDLSRAAVYSEALSAGAVASRYQAGAMADLCSQPE